jgi:nucleoside-diphosphate-sugar epimerase
MKVFVAGATGAIGRPLVSALKAAGHQVIGMTSKPSGLEVLQTIGADGVIVDALDTPAIQSVIKKIGPDAVIEELTSLPREYTPEEMRAAAQRDRRLRLEGGSNVHNAARLARAKRYVVQSTGFFYAPGQGLAAETEPLAINASPAVSASVRTYIQVEQRVLEAPDLPGVALRYGFFYGPHTYHDETDGSITRQVRARKYPVVGSGQGIYSFVHVEDAAAATVAFLEAAPGIYNIVDDDPCPMALWLPAFARLLAAPDPPRISEEDAVRAAGPDVVYYATRLRGASNACAKLELGFAPRRLQWLASR